MRVVVVGAGLAGLRTAQLLTKAGHEVLVYEARDRVGGRLWTVESGDGFYDAGGEWVDSDHHRVLALMDEYGLKPEVSQMSPGRVLVGSKTYTEGDSHPDLESVEEGAEKLASKLVDPVWETAAELDGVSLGEWLDEVCSTDEGRKWAEMVQRSDEGEDTSEVGLLGWLDSYRNYLDRDEAAMSLYRIPGGSGSLCDLMASEMADRVFMERRLRSVDLTEEGVQCWFEGEVVFADKVVVTVPSALLGGIEWPVEMPYEYSQAWGAVRMARAIKVCLEFESAWWEGTDWKGRLLSDLDCQQVWIGGREGASVLSCYICGSRADSVRQDGDPVERVLAELGSVFPGALDGFMSGTVYDWVGEEFSGGAFPSLPVGAVGVCRDWLGKSWEGIHFAGDGTGRWFGFMEGALESAERVVREIGS